MATGTDLLTAEIDTAVFSDRRWYVAGYGRFWFSTKEDAESAIALTRAVARNERSAIADRMREALREFE